MPTLPPRICASCGRRTAAHAVCECRRQRKAEREKTRPGARERGYSPKWDSARAWFLREHRHRIKCGAPASVVDHVVAHKGDMRMFWNRRNWQPLCTSCHSRKTARQDGGFGNAREARP